MKTIVTFITIFFTVQGFAQSNTETELLRLSTDIFKWEVENKIDSLENSLNEKFIVIGSDGNSQLKKDYINRLKGGSFVHDSISVEEHSIVVSGNTAIVSGKGRFFVTVSGKKVQLHLSYMEVFTRENKKPWQVLAMKASVLDR